MKFVGNVPAYKVVVRMPHSQMITQYFDEYDEAHEFAVNECKVFMREPTSVDEWDSMIDSFGCWICKYANGEWTNVVWEDNFLRNNWDYFDSLSGKRRDELLAEFEVRKKERGKTGLVCNRCGNRHDESMVKDVIVEEGKTVKLCAYCIAELESYGHLVCCKHCGSVFTDDVLVFNPETERNELCPHCDAVWCD